MADNSSIPVAVGNETFANKDVSSVKYPRVLMTWGTGTPTDVSATNPVPVLSELGQAFGVAPSGSHKAPSMVVRADTPGIPHANGTYTYLTVDSVGKQWVNTGAQLGGTGPSTAAVQRMAIVDEQLGSLVLGSVPVITGGSDWYAYGAGIGFTAVQVAAGAIGDYIESILAVVTTTASQVQIRDSTGGAAFTILPAGVATIGTFPIPLGFRSKLGRWEVNTQSGVTIFVSGKFS